MMKRDVYTGVAEAEKLIKESAQATGMLGVKVRSMHREPVTSQL